MCTYVVLGDDNMGIFDAITKQEADRLVNHYILSTSAEGLYNAFYTNTIVQKIAGNFTSDELVEEYNARTSTAEITVENAVFSYVVLIAAVWLDFGEALKVFDAVDLDVWNWGQEIREIYEVTKSIKSLNELHLDCDDDYIEQSLVFDRDICNILKRLNTLQKRLIVPFDT